MSESSTAWREWPRARVSSRAVWHSVSDDPMIRLAGMLSAGDLWRSAGGSLDKTPAYASGGGSRGETRKPGLRYETNSSDTTITHSASALLEKVHALFEKGNDEAFEDGRESPFSRGLTHLILGFGNQAMEEVYYLISRRKVADEVSAEALRWLGLIQDRQTQAYRLALLEKCLSSPCLAIRDGAILGLSYMRMPHSISILEEALLKETVPSLREDIARLIQKLRRG